MVSGCSGERNVKFSYNVHLNQGVPGVDRAGGSRIRSDRLAIERGSDVMSSSIWIHTYTHTYMYIHTYIPTYGASIRPPLKHPEPYYVVAYFVIFSCRAKSVIVPRLSS